MDGGATWRPVPEEVSGTALRRVEGRDVGPLSACLARAFEDDPVSCYLFPSPRTHLARLEAYFAWQLRHVFIPKGEAWTTADLSGASLWMPPRRIPTPSIPGALVQLAAAVRLLGRRTGRALRLIEELQAVHPKIDHCYLSTIGTDPPLQGSGIGSALMKVVLARLDEEATPAFLESSKEENLAFYHRHGFTVTGEVGGRGTGTPRIWLMWREPMSPADPVALLHPSRRRPTAPPG